MHMRCFLRVAQMASKKEAPNELPLNTAAVGAVLLGFKRRVQLQSRSYEKPSRL